MAQDTIRISLLPVCAAGDSESRQPHLGRRLTAARRRPAVRTDEQSAEESVGRILAEGDATAIAAAHELGKAHWRGLADRRTMVETDSHTFARPGDMAALEAAVLAALSVSEPARSPS